MVTWLSILAIDEMHFPANFFYLFAQSGHLAWLVRDVWEYVVEQAVQQRYVLRYQLRKHCLHDALK